MNVTSRLDFDVMLTPPLNQKKKKHKEGETEIVNANARKMGIRFTVWSPIRGAWGSNDGDITLWAVLMRT